MSRLRRILSFATHGGIGKGCGRGHKRGVSPMLKEVRIRLNGDEPEARNSEASSGLHPAWGEFVRLCQEMGFGEIEIQIQVRRVT